MNKEDFNRIFVYLLDQMIEMDEKIEELQGEVEDLKSRVYSLEINDPLFND